MRWVASTYGSDSFMNRLPRALTMRLPGRLRSARQNQGMRGNGIDGPHQASSMKAVAAPIFWPARIPSPVLAAAPTVHSVPIGAR